MADEVFGCMIGSGSDSSSSESVSSNSVSELVDRRETEGLRRVVDGGGGKLGMLRDVLLC